MTGEAAFGDTVVVIHYIGWGCQSPNPQEIHCFNWEFCAQSAWCFSGL